MSTQVLGIEKILECPVCMDTYKKPKVLPCQHSFCLECLFKAYRDGHRFSPFKIKCPVCRMEHEMRTFAMSINDFDQQFPNHFILLALLDAKQKEVESKMQKVSEEKRHFNKPPASKPVPMPNVSIRAQEISSSPYSSSPRCISCVIEPKWHCVMCDKQLCNDCVSEHFEIYSTHEIFNLDAQLLCEEAIHRHFREMRAVTNYLHQECTWEKMWKEYMEMLIRSAPCITKGCIIGAYSSTVLARSKPPIGRDLLANENELRQISEIFRNVRLGVSPSNCSLEGVYYDIVSARDNIIFAQRVGGGFFAIKTRVSIIIAVFNGEVQEAITTGGAVERIAKILRDSYY